MKSRIAAPRSRAALATWVTFSPTRCCPTFHDSCWDAWPRMNPWSEFTSELTRTGHSNIDKELGDQETLKEGQVRGTGRIQSRSPADCGGHSAGQGRAPVAGAHRD